MLYNKLLKEEESTFVINSLSKLNLGNPQVRSISLFAIVTLKVSNNKFNDKALLKKSTIEHFFLNCKLDLDASRVRFCPHEASIHKLNSFKTFNLLQAKSQELSWFKSSMSPRWSEVAIAFTTMLQLKRFWDAFSNINLRFQTVNASVWLIWDH